MFILEEYRRILTGKVFIFFFVFFILSGNAFPQSTVGQMEKLALRFDSLSRQNLREEVYIQSSKDIFETGEDLWFKAYVLNAQNFTPSSLSKTLYLQLISEKTRQAVWNEKYEIVNGFADGHVFLQDSLSEGDYFLAAYTGHSFFGDSADLTSLKKITVKKDMKPRSSLIPHFNKVIYQTGDTIWMGLTALSEEGKPQTAQIEAELCQGRKSLAKAQATTNQDGKTSLYFVLQETGEGLRIDIKERYADLYNAREKTMSFAVPCKKGSLIEFNTFPEGGNLVAGIESNLAFKAVNIDGNPQDVAGTLYEGDQPLTEFKSSHAGMGSLRFTPVEGKHYSIRLSKPAIDSTFLLPEILSQGIALQLTGRDKEYLEFTVLKSIGLTNQRVYIRGQMRGVICCMAAAKLNDQVKIRIPLKEFPGQGIAELTLFDENLHPVAERLVYVNPEQKLSIEAKQDKDNYPVRGKAKVMIKVTDRNGNPVVANLGATVYDKLYQNPADQKNILTHYYLSTQLRGTIYEPTWYFDKKNNRERDLDLLLLTQGWRRYVWNEEKQADRIPVITDGIEGKVGYTKKLKQAPKGDQLIMAYNPEKEKNKSLIESDLTGRFTISPQLLKTFQGGNIYLKPMAPADFEPRISLNEPFQMIDQFNKNKAINYPLIATMGTAKEKFTTPYIPRPGVINLDEVIIRGRGTSVFRDKYVGHLDSIAKLETTDYVCSYGILNCQNHVNSDRNSKPVEGKIYKQYIVYNREFRYVRYHYQNYSEEELLKKYNLSRIKAYYTKREFYQPKYDKENKEDLSFDTRNTLLWAPSVVTNEKGEAILEFYCSDINTGFIGKIEGVSGDGLLGTGEFEFHVLKNKPSKNDE